LRRVCHIHETMSMGSGSELTGEREAVETEARKHRSCATSRDSVMEQEPPGVQHGIADADKKARTGNTKEPVRNTPPAGTWNDTSAD
jgi:hypothetical protein